MVHRIQNRNPGYSDFNTAGSAQSFNFSPTMTSPISHGANALKLENEIIAEPATNRLIRKHERTTVSEQELKVLLKIINQMIMSNLFQRKYLVLIMKLKKASQQKKRHVSNGLENFGVEGENCSRFI